MKVRNRDNCWIGVDPGKSGAIAFIRRSCTNRELYINVHTFPIAGKSLDLAAITNMIKDHIGDGRVRAVIERVGAMPGQGVTSMFTFGFSTGAIHGILAALSIPIIIATPQAWKAKVLSGTPKDKLAAIDYCRRVYPYVSLLPDRARKPNPNMADALCIATYCRDSYSDF